MWLQFQSNYRLIFTSLFICSWLLLLSIAPSHWTDLVQYAVFSLLGLVGGIFANSTGAGGGVIFIPMFNELGFNEVQSVATSFGIQCFGMTAGAITWLKHYQKEKTDLRLWQGFKRIIAITAAASVFGILLTQYFTIASPASLHLSFSWFSLVLGIFIVLTIYLRSPHRDSSQLTPFDIVALILIGIFGGAITAWLSVGVGELVAIYLILRRFDVTMAVAAAVVISAITVWAGIWQHTLVEFTVYWQVVLFAGPAAVLGGIAAKTLVTWLSATRLKLFFAFWLLVTGSVGIFG